jgi:AcrR family transcriptional regulator
MTKGVRTPKQSRSQKTKETITKTALDLFCRQGFHETTTNQIAEVAGVAIGSVYAYFRDREAILYEILERHHQQFQSLHEQVIGTFNTDDIKRSLHDLIDRLIRIHQRTKKFNRELNSLYFTDSRVAEIRDTQDDETKRLIAKWIRQWDERGKVKDPEATAAVAFILVSGVVDQIVFGKKIIQATSLIRVAVEVLQKYLAG